MSDKFTRDEETVLIELVSLHKCLYDVTDKDYKDIIAKENAWQDIASHIESKTDDDCKKRWRSIRDTYKRLKREGKLATASTGTVKRNKWPLLNYLLFLENIPEDKKAVSNLLQESQESLDGTVPDINIPKSQIIHHADDCETSPKGVAGSSTLKTSNKRKNTDGVSKLLEENIKVRDKIFEVLFMKKYATTREEDDVDMFYKSLALTVKRLPPHLVSKAKLQHLQIVNNLEREAEQQRSSGIGQPTDANSNDIPKSSALGGD